MGEITLLLEQWRAGDREAEQELFSLVTPNLRRLARHLMKGERADHSLQATELVNQVYLKLVAAKNRNWQNRRHFFALAGRAMRRHLIDHARGRPRAEFVAMEGLEEFLPADSPKIELAISTDLLLNELAESQPDWCQIVELKFFLGLTDDQAAEVMGLNVRTMKRKWADAREWLFERSGGIEGAPIRTAASLSNNVRKSTGR